MPPCGGHGEPSVRSNIVLNRAVRTHRLCREERLGRLKHKQRRLKPAHRGRELHLSSRKILFEPMEPQLLLPISSRMRGFAAGVSGSCIQRSISNDIKGPVDNDAH